MHYSKSKKIVKSELLELEKKIKENLFGHNYNLSNLNSYELFHLQAEYSIESLLLIRHI
jgi:hypothetical protein